METCVGGRDAETGEALDFELTLDGQTRQSSDGRLCIELSSPEAFVLTHSGHLPEPWVLNPGDDFEVDFFAAESHSSLHFGGDVMMGRRYEERYFASGNRAEVARELVEPISQLFGAADFSTVNLETVATLAGPEESYPGKRFLLNTHPEALSFLNALGADLVTLGNNHIRDWGDEGVRATLASLAEVGIAQTGGGLSEAEANAPNITTLPNGLRVGTFSWTTVAGDFVNEQYPGPSATAPVDLAEEDAWLYERRSFGFSSSYWNVLETGRRIGDVWERFRESESSMSAAERAEAWAAIEAVFPEMQDWGARRGHGGAAVWSSSSVEAIESLRSEVDILIVQIHAGFQFATSPSGNSRALARAAVEAGADLVIGHHPHVLQGLEWIDGKLAAYSLGNFVFDQDFHTTFPGAMLRTVFRGGELVQARVIATVLSDYRIQPVGGVSAERIYSELERSSAAPIVSRRFSDLRVREVLRETSASLRVDDRGRILAESPQTHVVEASSEQRVEPSYLISGEGEVGFDLLGTGSFESDFHGALGMGWSLRLEDNDNADRGIGVVDDALLGNHVLRVRRTVANLGEILTRPVARVPLRAHRRFDEGGDALDPEARFEVVVGIRSTGRADCPASVRVDYYQLRDQDPTMNPVSEVLGTETHTLPFSADWQRARHELTPPADANFALIYLRLEPPEEWTCIAEFDDVRVMEWRSASANSTYAPVTHVAPGAVVNLAHTVN